MKSMQAEHHGCNIIAQPGAVTVVVALQTLSDDGKTLKAHKPQPTHYKDSVLNVITINNLPHITLKDALLSGCTVVEEAAGSTHPLAVRIGQGLIYWLPGPTKSKSKLNVTTDRYSHFYADAVPAGMEFVPIFRR